MSWNYRIVIKTTEDGDHYYGIHEVYYDEAGLVGSCTENPCDPFGETRVELQDNINQMAEAFTRPVLHYDDIFTDSSIEEPSEFMYTTATPVVRRVVDSLETVREVVNELYRSSYLDFYAKKKILEAMNGTV